jgi:short-subunit dehydrogenase
MTDTAKHAVVLGGSRGLGENINIELERRGWKCTNLSRTRSLRTKSHFFSCDLSNPRDVERTTQALKEMPTLDAFFWVAGEHLEGPTVTMTSHAIRRLVEVNLLGGLILAVTAWRYFQCSGNSGNLAVISSTSGTKARENESLYCATKFAQVGFARSLGIEAENTDHKVPLFMPGGMKTSMWTANASRDVSRYLNPMAIAQTIVAAVTLQTEPFFEIIIPRSNE